MARLIDEKELEKQIKEVFENTNPVLMGQMLRWVRKQKTIDAVPVIRCKDCKFWDDDFNWCDRKAVRMQEDDFCSYGERKCSK